MLPWTAHCSGRRIEDKAVRLNFELRPFNLFLNTESLHGNRELPISYPGWILVQDITLPTKGTQHRMREKAQVGKGAGFGNTPAETNRSPP